jgi:hypothetical protein
LDANRTNNRAKNLRWGTLRENVDDWVYMRHGRRALIPSQVEQIKQLLVGGFTYMHLARMFCTSFSTIQRIACGDSWRFCGNTEAFLEWQRQRGYLKRRDETCSE